MNDLLIFVPPDDHDDITLAICNSGGYIPRPNDDLIVEMATLKDASDPRAFDNAHFRVVSILPCLKNMEKTEKWITYAWSHMPNTIYVRVIGISQATQEYIDRLVEEYESEEH